MIIATDQAARNAEAKAAKKAGTLAAIAAARPKFVSRITMGKVRLNIFGTEDALNEHVANCLIMEAQKPGLIVLPSDSTHGDEAGKPLGDIYRRVNEYFMDPTHVLTIQANFTHMDELNLTSQPFGTNILTWLDNLMRIDTNPYRFYQIDPSHFRKYKNKLQQGPRIIFGGIGAQCPPHLAYIGENLDKNGKPILNLDPAKVTLREEEAERRKTTEAYTMGLNSFRKTTNPKLETIILTAKGGRKAEAIHYALREAFLDQTPEGQSACGQVIKGSLAQNGPKLELNLDQEAWSKVANDEELMRTIKTRETKKRQSA